MKKLSTVVPLIVAASAAAIALAPIASADVTVEQTPGNVQVEATPGVAALQAGEDQMPFGVFWGGGPMYHRGR